MIKMLHCWTCGKEMFAMDVTGELVDCKCSACEGQELCAGCVCCHCDAPCDVPLDDWTCHNPLCSEATEDGVTWLCPACVESGWVIVGPAQGVGL